MGENYGWFTWQPPPQCKGMYTWRKNQKDWIPPKAMEIGKDKDGTKLYAGRAKFEGDLLPAKVSHCGNKAYVPYGGKEHEVHEFEILASQHIGWQHSREGNINAKAMIVGHTKEGENLYMGRVEYEGTLTPGKVHPTHKCLYIPYNGKEITIRENYEIMLLL